MKINLSIFLLGIFLISLASANGLSLDVTTIQLNKTNGIDQYFNLTISNQESSPTTFYNISSQNPIISFDKFNLESGQNKTIQVKVTTNSNFNGQIKIVGDYWDNLGTSDEIIEITFDSNGLDICNLDLIVGDTLIWENTLISSNIQLKNLNTGVIFTTISPESTYLELFNEAKEFNYQVFVTGLPFSNICHLNIRPTSGYIHSSIYDAMLDLDIKINYEPTTISATFLTDSYTLNYNSQTDDLIKITNTGNKTAKNIKLSGSWFEFNLNNFDLAVGESKNIGCTIDPFIYETNQTNKTHNKSIKIEGNFNTIEKQIDVFINYKDLSGIYGDSSFDKETLQNIVNFFCSVYPDDCPVRYIYGNESDQNVTITINEETYKQGILADVEFRELIKSMLRKYSEDLSGLTNSTSQDKNDTIQTSEEVKGLSDKINALISSLMFGVVIFVVLLIIGVIVWILFNERTRIKLGHLFHKGELY